MYHMKMSLTDFLILEIIIEIFVDFTTNKCAILWNEFYWDKSKKNVASATFYYEKYGILLL